MTSIASAFRQVSESSHYISIAPLQNKIFTSPLGSVAPWASSGATAAQGGGYVSTLSTAGALLRDMGKTVVSSGSYFRKVQLVVPFGTGLLLNAITNLPAATGAVSTVNTTAGQITLGVGGPAANGGVVPDFLTGYIQLGFEGGGVPAPVAKFGR